MLLPLQSSLQLLQTKWKSVLDPIISNPTTNMSILKNVKLYTGDNQVSHFLQRPQQGWIVVDINGVADVYRYRDFDSIYLYLNSSADVTVSLGVF